MNFVSNLMLLHYNFIYYNIIILIIQSDQNHPPSPYTRQGMIAINKRSSPPDLYIYIQFNYTPTYHRDAFNVS